MILSLNGDALLRLMPFLNFVARDVVLELRPDIRSDYRIDLAKQYNPTAVAGITRALGYLQTKGIPLALAYPNRGQPTPQFSMGDSPRLAYARNGLQYQELRVYLPFHLHANIGSRMATLARAADTFRGALVVGTNIRYLELGIGLDIMPGSRTYYKTRSGGKRAQALRPKGVKAPTDTLCYQVPHFVDQYRGLPLLALQFAPVKIQCNPDGVLHSMWAVYDFENNSEKRSAMAFYPHVGLIGQTRMRISNGVATMHEFTGD